jgi:hypothetical protein
MNVLILVCLLVSPSASSAPGDVILSWSSLFAGLDAASEPGAALLLGIGLLVTGCVLRRRGKFTSGGAE